MQDSGTPRTGLRVLPGDRLSYGMQVPVTSLSTLYAEPWEVEAGPRELRRIARAADRLGFAYLATCDHVAVPTRLAAAMGTVWYDPVATLAHLAAVTERTLLLSHVAVAALRHPLALAKQYATVDRLADGRLVLGVGAGHVREEFEALGVDFARRGAVLDETVDALKAALGPAEFPEFSGRRFAFRGLGQGPRPARTPRPPLWVGGSSPAALRRAALRGDGWLSQGDRREVLPRRVATLRRLREEAGRDGPFAVGAIAEPLYVGTASWDTGVGTLTGAAGTVAESLRVYRGMGVDQVQVRFRCRGVGELLEQMEVFAGAVGPLLVD
ncbi:TIGR03619 family F420-dependent LLM class oxidoreductase [Streptomyces albireticuli]|uniref:TIGR03619 family F420-dependent LLM class oxidoreductase n=1 Tax=Streptomyces albireticuli TaxID=1940 RepID=UPI001E589E8E|nr:TIGR03619 family F420-dependent LLM class oxidoreductase [Streptomyces albireticuli]MCD9144370.1 TIGR03619 family F420-dependent LLM class oxidoreductase [Streptomyces albireticuli]MCD9163567.1 TIGR03619 family F420-dependent LLM class oxidoreductase [Streptomyces albireticuli]MCD9193047.1 TIGR03619 family F420-dependent LLM class oxidoreductase [Streptomyces albireticuli]